MRSNGFVVLSFIVSRVLEEVCYALREVEMNGP